MHVLGRPQTASEVALIARPARSRRQPHAEAQIGGVAQITSGGRPIASRRVTRSVPMKALCTGLATTVSPGKGAVIRQEVVAVGPPSPPISDGFPFCWVSGERQPCFITVKIGLSPLVRCQNLCLAPWSISPDTEQGTNGKPRRCCARRDGGAASRKRIEVPKAKDRQAHALLRVRIRAYRGRRVEGVGLRPVPAWPSFAEPSCWCISRSVEARELFFFGLLWLLTRRRPTVRYSSALSLIDHFCSNLRRQWHK